MHIHKYTYVCVIYYIYKIFLYTFVSWLPQKEEEESTSQPASYTLVVSFAFLCGGRMVGRSKPLPGYWYSSVLSTQYKCVRVHVKSLVVVFVILFEGTEEKNEMKRLKCIRVGSYFFLKCIFLGIIYTTTTKKHTHNFH